MWARFLVELLPQLPGTEFRRAVDVVGPLRMVKDAAEIAALPPPAPPPTGSPASCTAGEIPLVGRTEAEVSADISARLIAEGHDKVNFAIVAAGANAASPHHHAGDRVIAAGEIVLCDFGGTMDGYCSDITRCVFTGQPPAEIAEAYAVLHEAQQASVAAAIVGTPCEDVDRAARRIIAAAGYGDHFIHRTGHGIGMEEHEDPYIVEGNERPLAPGHAFSVEPGIYLPGPLGHAARGHRRRHRRRSGPAERRRPRARRGLAPVSGAAGELGLVGLGGVRRHLDDHVGGVDAGQQAVVEHAVGRRRCRRPGSPRTWPSARRCPRSMPSWRRCGRRRRGAGGPPRSRRRSRAPAGCR